MTSAGRTALAAADVPDPDTGWSDVDEGEASSPTEAVRGALVALRTGESPDPSLSALAAFDDADLAPLREDRDRALAFWVNCYNAGTQRLLDRRPGLYESPLRFLRFFRAPCLTVAGRSVSLDGIEHGILRGRSKYGLGYLPRFLVGSFEQRYRLSSVDPRVHFALNCGAASCPPIRSYDPDRIDEQLDLATREYLGATVEYDPENDVVRLPRLFRWYRGDFGGRREIREFLREYDLVPEDASPRLRSRDWDWSRAPGKFVE